MGRGYWRGLGAGPAGDRTMTEHLRWPLFQNRELNNPLKYYTTKQKRSMMKNLSCYWGFSFFSLKAVRFLCEVGNSKTGFTTCTGVFGMVFSGWSPSFKPPPDGVGIGIPLYALAHFWKLTHVPQFPLISLFSYLSRKRSAWHFAADSFGRHLLKIYGRCLGRILVAIFFCNKEGGRRSSN